MNKFYLKHQKFWTGKTTRSLIFSLSFLGLALYVQQLASNYVATINGAVVDDLIVNHLPLWSINKYFVPATIASTIIVTILLLLKPQYLIFTIKSLAIFTILRSYVWIPKCIPGEESCCHHGCHEKVLIHGHFPFLLTLCYFRWDTFPSVFAV